MTADMEIDARVESVAEWMLGGSSYAEIVANSKREWKVCKRTVTNYISRANAKIREVRGNRVECMIEEVSGRLMGIHDAAFAKGDFSAATGALREYIKLLGLAEPERKEVRHEGDELTSLIARIRRGDHVVIDADDLA